MDNWVKTLFPSRLLRHIKLKKLRKQLLGEKAKLGNGIQSVTVSAKTNLECTTEIAEGVYIGDLLSWVMGRAGSGDAWITIMSNVNIAAVATLADTACIILAEGVQPDDGVTELACEKNINLLLSDRSAYETAVWLHERL